MKYSTWALYCLEARSKFPFGSKITDDLLHLMSNYGSVHEVLSKIERLPQSIITSLDPMTKKLVHTFLHQSAGSPFDDHDIRIKAISGFYNHSIPLELDSDDFFGSSNEIKTPTIDAFLSCYKSDASSIDKIAVSDKAEDKVKVLKICGPLPPYLASIAIDNPSDPPKKLLHRFICALVALKGKDGVEHTIKVPDGKTADELTPDEVWNLSSKDKPTGNATYICGEKPMVTIPDDDSQATTPENPDAVLETIQVDDMKIYLPILRTLWAYCQPPGGDIGKMTVANTAMVEDEVKEWFSAQKNQFLDSQPLTNPQLANPNADITSSIDHLANTITLDRNQRFAQESSEPVSGEKKWNKLEETFRKTILFAMTINGKDPALSPTPRLLSILAAGLSPAVGRLFRSWHNTTDMFVMAGMATNLGKGVLTSSPSAFEVNTFSPFFTPPTSAGYHDLSNDEERRIDLSIGRLSESQKDKMTYSKPFVPKSFHLLVRQVDNFHIIMCDILGRDALINDHLKVLTDAFKTYELIFERTMRFSNDFSAWILQHVHFKVQSCLHSCSSAFSPQEINFNLFSFRPVVNSILSQDLQNITAPRWYVSQRREEELKERKCQLEDRNMDRSNTRQKDTNLAMDQDLRVADGNEYFRLTSRFIPTRPVARYRQVEICNKFHLLGNCHSQCPRAITHVSPLPDNVLPYYKAQVREMRAQASRSDRNNLPQNDRYRNSFRNRDRNHSDRNRDGRSGGNDGNDSERRDGNNRNNNEGTNNNSTHRG